MNRQGGRLAFGIDLLLCVIMAVTLAYTIEGGFNISEGLRGNIVLTALACLALQGILFVSVAKPERKAAAFAACAVVSVLTCVASVLASGESNPVDDIPQNYFVFTVITLLVNPYVFALSRKRLTCVVLFALGTFACGLIQFLYTMNATVAAALFILTSLVMIGFRCYVQTACTVSKSAMPQFRQAGLVMFGIPLAALVMASVVVLGVIMPLNPPHAVIKLLNEYVSYEEQKVQTGVSLDQTAAHSVTSSNVDQSLPAQTTTDKKDDPNATNAIQSNVPNSGNSANYLSSAYSDVDVDSLIGGAASVGLEPDFPWMWVLVGVLALLAVLLTVPRFVVHQLRLRNITSRPPDEQVFLYYRFFLGRLKKLGIEKPEALSPVEFANLYRSRIEPYLGAQESSTFDHLTALYVRSKYGNGSATEEDLACMEWLYGNFYVQCRRKLGLIKYGTKYLLL